MKSRLSVVGSLDGYCLLKSVFLLLNHLLAVLDHYTLEALVNLLTSEVVDGSVSVLLGNGLDNFNTRAFEISLN